MNRHIESLVARELVNNLNEGGWFVTGGHLVHDISSPKFPVIKASFLGETLKIETSDRSFDVPSDNIVFINEWTASIRHAFQVKQQRKKIEGGGWREVPAEGTALYVQNPTFEENARKSAQSARDEKERRQKKEKADREAEALADRRRQFSANIHDEFVGKKLDKIEVVKVVEEDGFKLRLLFKDSSAIEITSKVCECYYYGGAAVVNGISLRNFDRPEVVSYFD